MSLLKRTAVAGGMAATVLLALAAPAAAHVTVNPGTAVQGGYAKVTFRVPNETDTTNTTKVEVNLPADTPFASVSLKPVAGWTMVAQKSKLAKPIEAHGTQLNEAVTKITWTAAADAVIKPGQFQEFDVSLGPLPEVDQVVFKALQTYSDGAVVRWIDEPSTDGTEPEKPAPVLKLTPAGAEGADAPAAAPGPSVAAVAEDEDDDGAGGGTWTGVVGIVLGLAGLVLGLLAYRRAAAGGTPATAAAGSGSTSRTAASGPASGSAASGPASGTAKE